MVLSMRFDLGKHPNIHTATRRSAMMSPMTAVIPIAAAAILLAGCGERTMMTADSDVERAIDTYASGHEFKADAFHKLHDQGIITTPADVGRVSTMLEMSCPLMNFPGATQVSPQRLQEKLATNWQMNVTLEQAQQFQDVQQDYCANVTP